MEIKMHLHHRWVNAGEEVLAKRIANVVVGRTNEVWQQEDGFKWHLAGNDWFMSGIENNEVKVYYRYGFGPIQLTKLEALQTFLQWILGP